MRINITGVDIIFKDNLYNIIKDNNNNNAGANNNNNILIIISER